MTRQELEKPDISELASICKALFAHYPNPALSLPHQRAERQRDRFYELEPDLDELAHSSVCDEFRDLFRDLVTVQLSTLRTNLEFALHNAKLPDWSDILSPQRLEWIRQLKGTLLEALDGIEATIDRLEEVRDLIRQQPALDHESESTVGPDCSLGQADPKVPEAVSTPERNNHNAANEKDGCYDIPADIPDVIHSSVLESEHGRGAEMVIDRRNEALSYPTLESRVDSKQLLPRSKASLGPEQKLSDTGNASKLGNNPSILTGTRDPGTCAEAEAIHQKLMQPDPQPSRSEHPQAATMNNHQPDLRVAIDFGTNTAVSWRAPKEESNQTRIISQWPGESGEKNKVPTVLAKEPSGGETRWGFLCEELVEYRKWRNLASLMHPEVHENRLTDPGHAPWMPRTTDRVHELVTLYLRQIYTHISNEIPKIIKTDPTFSQQLKLKTWDSLSIDFIFSTQATWKAPSSQCFRSIVSQAGFGEQKLHRVMLGPTEAEAAVFSTRQSKTAPKVQKGDVILSIIAGGETTDLSVVNATADTADSLILDYTLPITCIGLGSVRIDLEFTKLIEDRIEGHPEARSELPRMFAWRASQSDGFQTFKHALGPKIRNQPDDKFEIEVPGLKESYSNQDIGIERGRLSFTRSQLESCFDKTLQGIKDRIGNMLVNFQVHNRGIGIDRHVNYVVLSGGLGNSDYVLKELTTHFNELGKEANSCVAGSTKVFRAEGDVGMVVANGLLYGQGTKAHAFGNYIAQGNYGIIVEEPRSSRYPWGPKIHWLVKGGDTIQAGKPITVDITKRLENSDQGKWTEKIVWLKGPGFFLPETVEEGWDRGMKELHSVDIEVPQGTKLSSARTRRGKKVYPDYDFKLMLSVGPSGDCSVEVSENVIKRSG